MNVMDKSGGQVVRWGIIGVGNVAEFKSGPALMQVPGSTLVAVMRRDAEKARDFALRHNVPRWYADVDALLADPEVDAVYVASPHHLHLAHVTRAAQAGKPILCEKPAGVSTAEAQAIVDVCRAASVPLSVAYYRRYWPVVQEMRRLLADGAIGEVVQARVQLADHYQPDPGRPWITEPEQAGGGALANAGSHWIDLVRYLLGDVVEVTAACSAHFGGFRTEDTIGVQMRMASQALASLNVTLCSRAAVNEFDIAGTDGRLIVGPLSDGRLLLQRGSREPEVLHYPRTAASHTELVAEIVRRLPAGEPSPVPGEEAVATWRIMAAAYRACREGHRVMLGVMKTLPLSLPSLRTARLELRPLSPLDARDLFAIYGDFEVMQYASDPPFPSIETVDEMLKSVDALFREGVSLEWGVEDSATKELIGTCGLHSFDSIGSTAEIGCMLNRKRWGRGFMHEAVSAVLDYGFNQLMLIAITADIDAPNIRSKALFLRLGFVERSDTHFVRYAPHHGT